MNPPLSHSENPIIPRLSAHSLRLLTSCPRKFALRVANRYWPAPEGFGPQSAEMGQTFHLLVQQHRLGLDIESTLSYQKRRFPDLDILWKNYLKSSYSNPEEGWDEQELSFSLGGVPFSVRYDRLVRQGDDWVILDWKTGHADPHRLSEDWQTKLYPFALAEAGHLFAGKAIPPENIKMIYWIGRTAQELSFPYNTLRHKQDREVFIQKAEEASQPFERFLRRPAHCPDCHYNSLCNQDPRDILPETELLPRFTLDRRDDAALEH